MTRVAAILLALRMSAPHWSPMRETAEELARLEQRYHVRAELVIADVEHESRWHDKVVNPISGTMGLMQVQPMNFRACASSGWLGSEQCQDAATALSYWQYNLSVGMSYFAAAREHCKAAGRGSKAKQWLWLPTGWDAVSRSECGYRNGKRLPTPKGIAWLLKRMTEISR